MEVSSDSQGSNCDADTTLSRTPQDQDHVCATTRLHDTTIDKLSRPQTRKNVAQPSGNSSTGTSFVTRTLHSPDYSVAPSLSHDEKGSLSKQKSAGFIGQLPEPGGSEQGKGAHAEEKLSNCIMSNERFGAIQNSTGRSNENRNRNSSSSPPPPLSSYLILSPSSPIRICAISCLTHWIYSTVITITICAFVISSVYSNYHKKSEIVGEMSFLHWSRWALFVTLLLEIFIKAAARGLFIQKLAYLRISWDWLDIFSVIILFISIIIEWEAVEFVAAAIVLLKLVPLHPGSINAFIFLCSCAKKLIPVVLYGAIIIWIYGVVIFTLFVKYQHHEDFNVVDDNTKGVSKSNEATTSDNESGNRTRINVAEDDFVKDSEANKSQNDSILGLSMECLPSNFRSLSGSFIQAAQMLTLRYSAGGAKSLSMNNTSGSSCQYETYALSILETLTIISGTLPIICMSFAILCNFFQKFIRKCNTKARQNLIEAEENGENYTRHYHHRRRTASSIRSSTSNHHAHGEHDHDQQEASCGYINEVARLLCDWDYYFCCLANLQRRLGPWSNKIYSSKVFKILLVLVIFTDFLCTFVLLWFSKLNIEFSYDWVIIYYIKICFIIYTAEVVFRWFGLSSEEYWINCWAAFDLTIILIYWIGFIIIHMRSYDSFYLKFCGILMIRMLKIAPYWKTLNQTLKQGMSSVVDSRHNLFVILICSLSALLLKYAIFALEARGISQIFSTDLQFLLPLDFYTVVDSTFRLIFQFLFSVVVVVIFMKSLEISKSSRKVSTVTNHSISFLLSHHDFDDLTEPRHSIYDSSPMSEVPGANGVGFHSHHKYRKVSSPCEMNGLLTHDTRSMLSPSSDVLSPLLSLPVPNGINGHGPVHIDDHSSRGRDSPLENLQLRLSPGTAYSGSGYVSPRSSKAFTLEDVLNFSTAALIVLSSINIIPENNSGQMSWHKVVPRNSLWTEVAFIMCIVLHIVYRIRLTKFSRETFMQICSIFDLIVILAAGVEIFSYGMRWVPLKNRSGSVNGFVGSAKILSSCRGLLIFSRLSWLQSVGSGMCYEIWKIIKHIAAFFYLWLIFVVSSVETQEMLMSIQERNQTSHMNETEVHVESSNNPETRISNKFTEGNFTLHPLLFTLAVLLILLNLGIVLGALRNRVGHFNGLFEKFMTPSQVTKHRISQSRYDFAETESEFSPKPTAGTCVPIMYFVSNHRTFDVIVMLVIFFDAIEITFEHYATSERADILKKHYTAYMLFLYGSELCGKIIGNGFRFFKSWWNVFDFAIITICSFDFCLSLIYNHWVLVAVGNLRFSRILRIFQFYPFTNRAQIIPNLLSALQQIIPLIGNHGFFYLCLYLAILTFRLGCGQAAYSCVEGLTEVLTNSLDVTMLWIAAPFKVIGIDSIFQILGNPPSTLSIQCVVYSYGLLLFSLIRIAVISNVCLIIVATLCQYIIEQDQSSCREIRSHEHLDLDDKSSYLPCTSPDTLDIETSSSAGTSSRLNNTSRCMDADQNCIYEESSGCKVFFVEAMITTV